MWVALVSAAGEASALATPSWTRLLLSLLAVLALIALLALVLRALRARAGGSQPGSVGLTQEATLSLGRQERVVVVRAGLERYLLGVTPHGITTLARLPDADPQQPAAPAVAPDLLAWLGRKSA